MRQRPDAEDAWYDSKRFWTYSRHTWDPQWWHKWGVPSLGGDEWGRRTIVWGVGLLGYIVLAWRTCWCAECHAMRQQTYDMAAERWEERKKKIARGQCLCESLAIWRSHNDDGPKLVPWQACPCGHKVQLHDLYGTCEAISEVPPPKPAVGWSGRVTEFDD